MKHNKLVRDHIPDIIQKNGDTPIFHIATTEEYEQTLRDKLQEEVNEFLEDNTGEELADILEVLYALAKQAGITPSELQDICTKKRRARGGFEKRIILDETR